MFHPIISSIQAWAIALAVGATSSASAQAVLPATASPAAASPAAVAAPAPAPAGVPATATAPAPAYRSAFDDYRSFADQPVGGWAAANRDAADIGGWRAYAKAAHAPADRGAVTPPGGRGTAPATAHGSDSSSDPGDLQHAGHAGQTSSATGARP